VSVGTASLPPTPARLYLLNSNQSQIRIESNGAAPTDTGLDLVTPTQRWVLGINVASTLNPNKFMLYNANTGAWPLTVDTNGNLGLGTTSPTARIETRGSGAGSEALVFGHGNPAYANSIGAFEPGGTPFLAFFGRHSTTSADTLKRTSGGFGIAVVTAGLDGSLVIKSAPSGAANSDATNLATVATFSSGTIKLEVAGNAHFSGEVTGTNIHAQYQDVAEWVQASQNLEAGTVVVVDSAGPNRVAPSARAYDTRVAGVTSARPGVVLGEPGAGKVMVATTGRVRVKADAGSVSIHVGDLLVTSDRVGFAMKSEPLELGGMPIHRPGTLIGKALEPLPKGQEGEILVLLSLQ
jgi:hypothetical protein